MFGEKVVIPKEEIPDGVTSMGKEAFEGCFRVEKIVSLIKEPFAIAGKGKGGPFFEDTYDKAILYVPRGTIDKYRATEGWKDFATIKERKVRGGGEDAHQIHSTKALQNEALFSWAFLP